LSCSYLSHEIGIRIGWMQVIHLHLLLSQVSCFLDRHKNKIRPFSFKFKSRWLSYEYT
jgi:hypothetical protein